MLYLEDTSRMISTNDRYNYWVSFNVSILNLTIILLYFEQQQHFDKYAKSHTQYLHAKLLLHNICRKVFMKNSKIKPPHESLTERNLEVKNSNNGKDNLNLMKLQGECRIKKIILLKLNIPKAILLTLLVTVSVLGLLFIVWYRSFRVKLWFFQAKSHTEATHAYIEAQKQVDSIVRLRKKKNQNSQSAKISFHFKKLRYGLDNDGYHIPIGFCYQQKLSQLIANRDNSSTNGNSYLKEGLSQEEIKKNRDQYGQNKHPVNIKNYFSYLFDILLEPFFLLQYVVCLSYVIEGFFAFTIITLSVSIISTTVNYILMYIGKRKIKKMAQKTINVKVLRGGNFVEVVSTQLVPGDLIEPENEIICDCILVQGDLYVNQASLTGETIPIGKFSVKNLEQANQENTWIIEGSNIIQKKTKVLALVVNTGFTTRKGRIIRKISTKVPIKSQMFSKGFYFLLQAFVIAMIIYFSSITLTLNKSISVLARGMRFVDFLGWSFPPTFPIYFNLAYSFAMVRLRSQNIQCMQPDKTVEASNLKVMCFDKTGKLTENDVQIHQIFRFQNADLIIPIKYEQKNGDETSQSNKKDDLVWKLFATCHTAKNINGTYLGDEIDVKMYLYSQYQMVNADETKRDDIKFSVKSQKEHLKVLKINQFQSRFQQMSVLVRDISNNQLYVFIKGAPEKIHANSILKVHQFQNKCKSLSSGGYRSIAFGYKAIEQRQLANYLSGPRQIFVQNITELGIAAFENKLKHDTRETIDRIVRSGIEPKIITGDNIFIAVEIGTRAGVVSPHQDVILLQRKGNEELFKEKQQNKNNPNYNINLNRTFKGIRLKRKDGMQEAVQLKQNDNYLTQPLPIAIDNDFLTLEPPFVHNIKLFARISPENKAVIIKKFKNLISDEFKKQHKLKRIFGELKRKVGMCGDGANDLMAIRQSDVGIGISNSDASSASTFGIKEMLSVDYIIRDSKGTTTNIMEMIRYYEFISYLKIVSSVLMMTDTANFNQRHVLFTNFTCTSIYPTLQALSKPASINTNAIPNGNFLGPVNQARFWGSLAIAAGGLVGGFLYFVRTPQFQANPFPIVDKKFYEITHSASIMLLLVIPPCATYSIFFYIGSPWKRSIQTNVILFGLTITNIVVAFAIHIFTKQVHDLLLVVPISPESALMALSISTGACILGYLYNLIINSAANRNIQIHYINEDKKKPKIEYKQKPTLKMEMTNKDIGSQQQSITESKVGAMSNKSTNLSKSGLQQSKMLMSGGSKKSSNKK